MQYTTLCKIGNESFCDLTNDPDQCEVLRFLPVCLGGVPVPGGPSCTCRLLASASAFWRATLSLTSSSPRLLFSCWACRHASSCTHRELCTRSSWSDASRLPGETQVKETLLEHGNSAPCGETPPLHLPFQMNLHFYICFVCQCSVLYLMCIVPFL